MIRELLSLSAGARWSSRNRWNLQPNRFLLSTAAARDGASALADLSAKPSRDSLNEL